MLSEKQKRRVRMRQKETYIKRQDRIYKQMVYMINPTPIEPHRFAKKSALTCGNSNCVMCGNPRKVFGEKTIQEKKHELYAEQEWLQELELEWSREVEDWEEELNEFV